MSNMLPSEEKIWLRHYNEYEIKDSFQDTSLYEAIHHVDNENRIALKYFGIPIPYKTLYEKIDLTAKAFVRSGIRKGDVVMLMLPTLPESIYCFYALNKIGAISNMIDVRSTPAGLVEIANKTKPKMLVVMTFYLKQLETVREQLSMEKIILLRGCDSAPAAVTFWYKLGEKFNGRSRITKRNQVYSFWDDFIDTGVAYANEVNATPASGQAAVIYQTSGTTGLSKSVVHTNESLDFSAKNRQLFLYKPQPGDTMLSILPIFTMCGFVYCIHLPLRMGMTVFIVPLFKPSQMVNLIKTAHPNFIQSVPSQLEDFIKQSKAIGDLSFVKDIFYAGEVLDNNVRAKVNKILHDNGSKAVIRADYGMTELGGSISLQNNNAPIDDIFANGYSGIPLPYVNVCIYDNDSEMELGYNIKGEICVQTPCALTEYLHDKVETDNFRRKHPDGSSWIHTGDIGYLSENGHLYFVGRKKRMIVRYDGTKIFPIEIESVIKNINGVSECSVVPKRDPNHSHGYLPILFVVPEDGISHIRLKHTIHTQCTQQLPVYLQPSKVQLIEQMPHNSAGKIDYRKLGEMI